MPAASVLPVIVKAQYQGGDAFGKLIVDAKRSSEQAKRQFDQDFADIGRTTSQALARPRNASGALDLGADEMRAAATNAQAHAIALREVADAAVRQAAAMGGASAAISSFVLASRSAAMQAEREARGLSESDDGGHRADGHCGQCSVADAAHPAFHSQHHEHRNLAAHRGAEERRLAVRGNRHVFLITDHQRRELS